jgi:23S rRNA (cytosine1962-C5)-methyltransferase
MKNINLISEGWSDYELLDSGGGRKLERFGQYKIIRPEPQAIWEARNLNLWQESNAEFVFEGGRGIWKNKKIPSSWEINFKNLKLICRINNFKHIGIFPEQLPNWEWLEEKTLKLNHPQVLNLFGYSGVASLIALKNGGNVTHLDASAQANKWTKENIFASQLTGKIRILLDDALKFSKRELKRKNFYDGIVLDPPAFGRGPKGEVWKIERDLPELLKILFQILKKQKNSFFLLNSYAAGYSPWALKQLVEDFLNQENFEAEFGEMQILEKNSKRVLPSGVYFRLVFN